MEGAVKKTVVLEIGITTVVLLSLTSLLNVLQNVPFIGKIYGLVFAVLFVYVPVFLFHRRREQLNFLDRDWRGYLKSFLIFLIVAAIIFPLFFIAAHFWMKVVYHGSGPVFRGIKDFWNFFAYQLLMVALPEEFYFRGYMQGMLNRIYPKRWKFLGVRLGPAWVITAVVFALAHSIIVLQWWHFAIFFPALVFGYLRERTGSITAPILFHAASNIVMNLIVLAYF